jgi:shikimate kinase
MSRSANNIFLIGFSGTGKSHIGRLVAASLGWRPVDTDILITRKEGAPIVEIFEQGEAHFRSIEQAVITEVSNDERQVVSTGGGVPVDQSNRVAMRNAGIVVLLRARPETIQGRLERGLRTRRGTERQGVIRPMLDGDGDGTPIERIEALLTEREEAYACADAVVDTDDISPDLVANQVIGAWRRIGKELH